MKTILAPCPRCSSRVHLARPQWVYARHTSAKREQEALAKGKPSGSPAIRCYVWVGDCSHASAFFNNDRNPIEDSPELAEVEARWDAEVLRLFNALTERWTPAQRALHARTLGIKLPPEPPAQ